MRRMLLMFALTSAAATPALAVEGNVQVGTFGGLDHLFVIIMENHSSGEIVGNPNAPFITGYAASANYASNYWAVGHPSLTNYLEIVGGSNFGLTDDNWPVWVNGGCKDNNPAGSGCGGAYTPISGAGLDFGFPATVDACAAPWSNQISPGAAVCIQGPDLVPNDWALYDYSQQQMYTPKTIAHQLVETGRQWKTYQQSLPAPSGTVDGVNYADGTYSNLSDPSAWQIGGANVSVQKLYAVKHNPFVYFKDIEEGTNPLLSLGQTVDFDGPHGLFADLARGITVPSFSFIVPDQCHDMHGAGGGSAQCADDTHAIQVGDAAVRRIVEAIHASPVWLRFFRTAIVVVWDENDYAVGPNKVSLIVDTNYGKHGVTSSVSYDHYSLTRTIEAAFELPCLNHACDKTSKVMNDLFSR